MLGSPGFCESSSFDAGAEVVVSCSFSVCAAVVDSYSVAEVDEAEVLSVVANAEYTPVDVNNTAIDSINTSTLSVTRLFITLTSTMINC